ncbi:UvrB/UvrC motif-containing protein [Peribacillus sp. SCS-155]|uniref:UvrB/UvrC motif-containing protein n=1 Tax=Peribacillus sedimenti TaxID=3115297 RepID=UPI003906A76A
MICQECNERPATLHFTKIVNGEKNEVHICEKCAHEKGEMFLLNGGSGFSINNLLAGLLNIQPTFQHTKPNTISKPTELNCKRCGLTFSQFVHTGKFGCGECYSTFESQLDPILKRLHGGNTVHHGKVPKRIGGSIHTKKQIAQLKGTMKTFIENEEFEKAAEIRDHIRYLEQSSGNGDEGGRPL